MNLQLISDFNLETLQQYLLKDSSSPQLSVTCAPFGQVFPALLEPVTADRSDFALIWTSPDKIIPAFAAALEQAPVDETRVLMEVRNLVDCLLNAKERFRAMFVVSWTLPPYQRGNGLLSLRQQGVRKLLLKMNLTLAEALEGSGNIYLLDGQRWVEAVGKNAYSPKMWYLAKSPFHADVFRYATGEVKAAVSAVLGATKKLLVVDLDNTLWGGVVGDLGWEKLRLGGHDYQGEAFVDFQKTLKSLKNRGVLLAIASRNEEGVALEALTRHPEMVLHPSDFAAWRINWNDKAKNIAELVAELNLGLQSVVFIDDNPVERARVREALPEVYVPEWPDDKTLFASTLLAMDCFDSAHTTAEDASRTEMYAAERERLNLQSTVSSAEEWLLSLNTHITVEELNDANRGRAAQLLNKTNQMNLSTRRLTEQELQNWLQSGHRKLWVFRVKDKFGDSGLTGILSLEVEGDVGRIVDFVLSCRVMGRNVEQAMVAFAAQHCAAVELRELQARYLETAKNKPCLRFWMASGFSFAEEGSRFSWQLNQPYEYPRGIEIRRPQDREGDSVYSKDRVTLDPKRATLPVLTN